MEIPIVMPLRKRMQARPGQRDISSALAWDDLTGMRLDAGQVKEARSKEVDYIHKMKVWRKIPRTTAQSRGWKLLKRDGSTSIKVTIRIQSTVVDSWGRNSIMAGWKAFLPERHPWRR